MKVYIAGPMTGYADYNFPMFDLAKHILQFMGYEVISPADIDRDYGWVTEEFGRVEVTDSFDFEKALAIDMSYLSECDAIALLPDWQKSRGAKMELERALNLGLHIIIFGPDMQVVT